MLSQQLQLEVICALFSTPFFFNPPTFREEPNYIAEMEAKLAVYAHLAQAADDVKLGRVQDLDAACDDILSELDGLEL